MPGSALRYESPSESHRYQAVGFQHKPSDGLQGSVHVVVGNAESSGLKPAPAEVGFEARHERFLARPVWFWLAQEDRNSHCVTLATGFGMSGVARYVDSTASYASIFRKSPVVAAGWREPTCLRFHCRIVHMGRTHWCHQVNAT